AISRSQSGFRPAARGQPGARAEWGFKPRQHCCGPSDIPPDEGGLAVRRAQTRGGFRVAALQVEGESQMIDVIFPKRAPTPRELATRPVPSDSRPKQLRAAGAGADSDDGYYGDEPGNLLDMRGINLHRLEEELCHNRLNEIATLMRALTYGEMMELA